jgi:hypothetical protein
VSAGATANAWENFYRDVNRLTTTAVSYWSAVVVMAGALVLLWFDGKPDHPMVAPMVTVWTSMLGPGVAIPVMLRLPPRWFRVSSGEQMLHRVLGVGAFGRLLERSGYNRRIDKLSIRTPEPQNFRTPEPGSAF